MMLPPILCFLMGATELSQQVKRKHPMMAMLLSHLSHTNLIHHPEFIT